GAPAPGLGAGEQPVRAADRDATQGPFGRAVVERQAAVIEAAAEGSPTPPHIAEGGGQFGFARQLADGLVRPDGERLADRFRLPLAFSSSVIGRQAVDCLLDTVELADAIERLFGNRRADG